MLAALSQVTSTAELGQLVTCSSYRNAGLLAKEAACIDVFSGGRLILGLGAGWYEPRVRRPTATTTSSDRERLAGARGDDHRHPAALVRGDRDLRRGSTSASTARTATRSRCASPRPPIWVGGGGEKVTLRIAAEHADATNWQVGLDQFVHKSKVLEEHCDRIGPRLRLDRPHPRSRLSAVRHGAGPADAGSTRPAAGQLWGRTPARGLPAGQLRRDASSRSPSRCRGSSTPGAGSSCSGSGTSRRARASSASRPRSFPRSA